MADPHEALRRDVEQEATDELVDIEAQDLLLSIARVVSVAEGDTALPEAQDAMVGDCDAMGAGAKSVSRQQKLDIQVA